MWYRFYDYELDEARHEVRRAGTVVALEPKVFQVLCYLLQYHNRVVTKAELFEHCWPDTFVTEAALTRCLTKLRRALRSDRAAPRVVQTVHGQGYRFVAPVETHASSPVADIPSPPPSPEPLEPRTDVDRSPVVSPSSPPRQEDVQQATQEPGVFATKSLPHAERRQSPIRGWSVGVCHTISIRPCIRSSSSCSALCTVKMPHLLPNL